MSIFLLSFAFFVIVIAAMAVGVIVKNRPIKGSCGGLNAVGIEGDCMICGKSAADLAEEKQPSAAPLFYEVK